MDPIADMFSQIKNAQNAKIPRLKVPFSKHKLAILGILKASKQIADFQEVGENTHKKFIEIKLYKDKSINFKIISHPGRRFYSSSAMIPQPRDPQSMVIVSTSEGVMKGEEARKKGLGGEIIAEFS